MTELLNGVVLLAAFTSRSKAYAQALAAAGLAPAYVLTFGDRDLDPPLKVRQDGQTDLFLPDLSLSLTDTISRAGWHARQVEAKTCNDPEVAAALAVLRPRLVIYSGYGGQLVKAPLFSLGVPILHMHAGWLPDYRGSTTIYYSWLERGECGVTAFLLSPGIDEGDLVLRKAYPPPPLGMDVDHVYDGAMRADVLVNVMRAWAKTGVLPTPSPQNADGRTFYVIHPVLKHVALLSREALAGAG